MSRRLWLATLCTLVVGACATQRQASQQRPTAPSLESAPVVNSGQDEVVTRKIASIAEFSVQARAELLVLPNDTRSPVLLAAPAAIRAIQAVKARVLDEFRDSRFVAVRRKLAKSLRTINEDELEYETAPDGERGVTETSFLAMLAKIRDLATHVPNDADVRVTFTVHSEPTGASFELCPQYVDNGCIFVSTDATIEIFRGRYVYRLSHDGFKTVSYAIDLVTFSKTRLDCRLHATRTSPCTPR